MYQNSGGYGGYNQGGFSSGGYAPPPQGGQGGYAQPPQGGQGGYAQPPQGGYAPPPQGQGYAAPPQGSQGGFASGSYVPPTQGGNLTPPAGYGQATQVRPEILSWFQAVDKDRSGQITWEELQAALINGQGERFSPTACKLMISMFDTDRSGTIGVNEFQLLYTYINQWLAVFKNYDRDQSGSIDEPELSQAFQQMGFRFSPEFVKFIIAKSDIKSHRNMSVDQFIVVCIQIQQFTEAFKKRDTELKGVVTLGFEDFLSIALSCSP